MKTLELTDEQIRSIAHDLDIGMKVYLHKETNEIKTVIDMEGNIYADESEWEEQIREIESDIDNFIFIERMSTGETYDMMKDFIDTVKDKELKNNLDLGLSLSNPFRNFRDIIDGHQEYREMWFEFKYEKYVDYIKNKLEYYKHELK